MSSRKVLRPPCLVDSPICLFVLEAAGGLFPCPLGLVPVSHFQFPFLAFICEGECWGGGGWRKEFEVFLIAVSIQTLYCELIWWAKKKFLVTHSHKILAIFCRLLIPKHVDSFLRPAHVSFGIPNNMFFYSLSILSCSLWRSVDCLLKNLWDIFAELILYAWENHAKRRKRGKSNLIFHFSPFSVAFEPNKDSTLSVVERGLISVAFSLSCSFVSVRRLMYSWLNFFLLAKFLNIPNTIVSCTILKKWTLSGWFLE